MTLAAGVSQASHQVPPKGDEAIWRTLTTFTLYRIIVILVLAIAYWGFRRLQAQEIVATLFGVIVLGGYFLMSVALLGGARLRFPTASIHLTTQVATDVIGLTFLMHVLGGVKSGIGLLLLISLAAAGIVSRGRMVYFHAAMAALAVLFEQSWQFLYTDATAADFVPSGLLAGTFFVVAVLGYTLAKYASGAERIAEARGVDLANLAQINELVIRDMQDGFVVVDERGIIRQHNAQSEAVIGKLAGSIQRPLSGCAPQLAEMLEEWRQDKSRRFQIMRDTNTQREYQVRFVAIGAQERSPTVIFIDDIGRVRMQAQQMKLVALGRLTASIAHEIRNPLSSIYHAAELLQEEEGRTAADARLLTIISDNARRLDRIVQEVLSLNRRDRVHPESIEVKPYLERFIGDFCAGEKIKPALITLVVEGGIRLQFDRNHLNQILWNLTRNACRHASGEAGCVTIRVDSSKAAEYPVTLSVQDDGPGVAAEAIPHIFEPFFTTDSQGTGLGLYIARELAEVNAAQLDYQPLSLAERRGACFRLMTRDTA
ncbi:MAG: two-component sensor histidine kinase [Betaproteobacteria bacterium]|nr:two-component sensor histidine kinase [Betaproteobacteria bacterium]